MTTCPTCGTPGAGNFCNACGAALVARTCRSCQASLSPHARFCHRCGTAVNPAATPPTPAAAARGPWIVAGSATLLAIAAIVYVVASEDPAPTVPQMANPGVLGATGGRPAGPAPDISQMSPRERFARLNDRVMQAAQSGDTATIVNFTPMALGAYAQLDSVDVDARYHAATLNAQVGNFAAALALADTIEAEAPGNLLASIVRAEVAEAQGDQAMARRAYAAFLAGYDREVAKNRQEYQDHRALLEQVREQAKP